MFATHNENPSLITSIHTKYMYMVGYVCNSRIRWINIGTPRGLNNQIVSPNPDKESVKDCILKYKINQVDASFTQHFQIHTYIIYLIFKSKLCWVLLLKVFHLWTALLIWAPNGGLPFLSATSPSLSDLVSQAATPYPLPKEFNLALVRLKVQLLFCPAGTWNYWDAFPCKWSTLQILKSRQTWLHTHPGHPTPFPKIKPLDSPWIKLSYLSETDPRSLSLPSYSRAF